MGLFLGDDDGVRVYIGSDAVSAIYVGEEKIWPTAPSFEPHLVSVTTPGPFSVPWPTGATACDVVLCGGGAGGQGQSQGPAGGNTTCTGVGTANGGVSNIYAAGADGESAENKMFNGETYPGGQGGAHIVVPPAGQTAGHGQQPGGGGGGASGAASLAGGKAGTWFTATITSPQTFTGSVGAGAIAVGGGFYTPGNGGHGIAHFWFYT